MDPAASSVIAMQNTAFPSRAGATRLLLSLSFLAAAAVHAQPAPVKVDNPWARGTVAGQDATGAFMTFTASEPLTLLGAATPAAGIVEIHQMKMEDNVMKMRAMDTLALPAGQPVAFAPGGYHFMMMDLKAPLKPGTTFPMTLRLRDAKGALRTVELTVPVAMTPPMAGHKR